MRLLSVVLSLCAASVAADHGTEVGGNGAHAAGLVWIDDFKAQIAQCYRPDQESGGQVAFAAVAFQMARNARPLEQTIHLAAATGQAGEARALEAARRALLRCGQGGYDLPLNLFSQWQFVEINFYYYVR